MYRWFGVPGSRDYWRTVSTIEVIRETGAALLPHASVAFQVLVL
jgi:hypothetical protein